MKILESALALAIFPAIAFTQTTDVDGWNGAKWGMTLAQVKAATNYNLERDPRFVSTRAPTVYRTAEPFSVSDMPVRANFMFSANENKLICVEVQVEPSLSGNNPLAIGVF
jgi:hypothetical protein